MPDLDSLVIPIGGGGLIAGIAIAAQAIKPDIEIFGVEAALYPSMWNALHGERPPMRRADAGRRHRGEVCRRLTLPIVRELVSDDRPGRRGRISSRR